MKNLPEVWEVEWTDSAGAHGWERDEAARELKAEVITSVGFRVAEDAERIVISPSTVHMPKSERGRSARFDCPTAIPKCAVIKMKRMRKARD